jgi:hypothetical protein
MVRFILAARRVRADKSWWRALELAADNREATLRQAGRWQLTNRVSIESPLGVR